MVAHLAYTDEDLPFIARMVDGHVLGRGQCEQDSVTTGSWASRPLRKLLTEEKLTRDYRKSFGLERTDLIYRLRHWMVLL